MGRPGLHFWHCSRGTGCTLGFALLAIPLRQVANVVLLALVLAGPGCSAAGTRRVKTTLANVAREVLHTVPQGLRRLLAAFGADRELAGQAAPILLMVSLPRFDRERAQRQVLEAPIALVLNLRAFAQLACVALDAHRGGEVPVLLPSEYVLSVVMGFGKVSKATAALDAAAGVQLPLLGTGAAAEAAVVITPALLLKL